MCKDQGPSPKKFHKNDIVILYLNYLCILCDLYNIYIKKVRTKHAFPLQIRWEYRAIGRNMARKKNPEEMDDGSDGEGFDYGEEPDFNDPEGFVDDVSDDELMPDIMKLRPKETDGVESCSCPTGFT